MACVFSTAAGQEEAQPYHLDMIVTIREHEMGPEIVQANVVRGDYPKDLLTKQMQAFAAALNSEARGLVVSNTSLGQNPQLSFLRAEFAVDHCIEGGAVRLEPLLKALAGAPEPFTIRGVKVILNGIPPSKERILRFHKKGVLAAVGAATADPPGLEYQFHLLTQDPAKIEFPERYQAAKPSPKATPSTGSPLDPKLVLGFFVVGGLAVGALVYLALLRPGSGRRR